MGCCRMQKLLGSKTVAALCVIGQNYEEAAQNYEEAAVLADTEAIWASALPNGTSAQRAKRIALPEALKLEKGKRLNIYTDSPYAHGARREDS